MKNTMIALALAGALGALSMSAAAASLSITDQTVANFFG